MEVADLASFVLLMIFAVFPGLTTEEMWQNAAIDIEKVLTGGIFQEVNVSSESNCIIMAAHKFEEKGACYQKPRCIIPTGTAPKTRTASTEWTCKETFTCEDPFVDLADIGCILAVTDDYKTYNESVTDCNEKGAYLAAVKDFTKFQKLGDYLHTSYPEWMAYYVDIVKDGNSVWRWTDTGTEVSENFWGVQGADSGTYDCAVMYHGFDHKQLIFSYCTDPSNYVCIK